MGLDIVELVMEVEEAFGVVIPDQEAEKILTVGDLHRWLLRQLGIRATGPCLSSVTFYRVRRALMEIGAPRRGVTPRTGLRELLPKGNRRLLWERFGKALGQPLRPRALVRPIWVGLVIAVMLLACAAGTALLYGLPNSSAAGALMVGTMLAVGLVYAFTMPLAVCFPSGYLTVRDVVLDLLTHHYGAIAAGVRAADVSTTPTRDREVWDALCRIIGGHVGADPGRLTESMRWQDLRAD